MPAASASVIRPSLEKNRVRFTVYLLAADRIAMVWLALEEIAGVRQGFGRFDRHTPQAIAGLEWGRSPESSTNAPRLGHANRPLPDSGQSRCWRDGRGLSRPRSSTRPLGGRQSTHCVAGRHAGGARTVPAGSAGHRSCQPSQHLHRVRRRPGRGRAIPGHGAPRRRNARRAPVARSHPNQHSPCHRDTDCRSARRITPQGRRASRSEAQQRDADAWWSEAPGLRPRQAERWRVQRTPRRSRPRACT